MRLIASIALSLDLVSATPATDTGAQKAAYDMAREQANCAVMMQQAAACHGSLSLDDRASRATMATLAAVLLKARDENERKAGSRYTAFRDTSESCEEAFNHLQAMGERCVWLAVNDTRGREQLLEILMPGRAR